MLCVREVTGMLYEGRVLQPVDGWLSRSRYVIDIHYLVAFERVVSRAGVVPLTIHIPAKSLHLTQDVNRDVCVGLKMTVRPPSVSCTVHCCVLGGASGSSTARSQVVSRCANSAVLLLRSHIFRTHQSFTDHYRSRCPECTPHVVAKVLLQARIACTNRICHSTASRWVPLADR